MLKSKLALKMKSWVTGGETRRYPETIDHQAVRATDAALKANGSRSVDHQTRVYLAAVDINALFAVSDALESIGFGKIDEIMRMYKTTSGFRRPPTGRRKLILATHNRALQAGYHGRQEEWRRGFSTLPPSILIALESEQVEQNSGLIPATVVVVRFPNNHEVVTCFEGAPRSINDSAFQNQLASAVEQLLRLAPEFLPKPLKPAVPRTPRA
jgi:hypothetical protein